MDRPARNVVVPKFIEAMFVEGIRHCRPNSQAQAGAVAALTLNRYNTRQRKFNRPRSQVWPSDLVKIWIEAGNAHMPLVSNTLMGE